MKIAQMAQKESRFSNFRHTKHQRDKRNLFSHPALTQKDKTNETAWLNYNNAARYMSWFQQADSTAKPVVHVYCFASHSWR